MALDSAEIATNLADVKARIAAAATAWQRTPEEITLVAVSKTNPVEAIKAAIAAGQRVFGENRVQEALAKFPGLRARYPDLLLHLIGPLQSNKAREAVMLFDVIETLDRPKLAEALAEEMIKQKKTPGLLIQVNTGQEPQKAGIAPEDADAFISHCRDTLKLPIRGLMCIPPATENPAPHFALLREIARRNGLAHPDRNWLSMGMSGDYETAIAFGATHVRVGSAIFGARH